MKPGVRWLPIVGLVVFAIVMIWTVQAALTTGSETSSWSELKDAVARGDVSEVVFDGPTVRAKLSSSSGSGSASWMSAVRVDHDEGFIALLEEKEVPYQARPVQGCQSGMLLLFLFPLLLMFGFWFLISQRDGPGRGVAAFSRSTAQVVPEEGTGVTFADVAGVDEAAEELQEIVSFLEKPDKFTSLGGRPPKGVLLVGPPGTGKTLLARAVAGEAGVAFFSISGSGFVEMFVGVGAARVRDLFKNAGNHAPCIIFIDELDAVGKARGVGGPGGNDEREQTLNQLLVEMDGFDNRNGVIVMAATNRPETLDQALLRPGRFDRQVLVDRPDLQGRLAILQVHGRKLKLDDALDLAVIAQLTPGFAGADLANVLNEAALLAARRDAKAVELMDVQESIERVVAGLQKKSRRLSPDEKRTVAYHECGHAICAAASPGADPVTKISIIPRGISALGYTVQLPLEDRYLMSKTELLNRITVLYGGRAAEELVFGDVTTGAYDDIDKATDLARRMVTEYGMSKTIGAVRYSSESRTSLQYPMAGQTQSMSPETAEAIEVEIRRILQNCHRRAQDILTENRVLLEEMSAYLLAQEVLDGERMTRYLSRAEQADSLEDRPTAEWLPTVVDPKSSVQE